MKSLAAHVAGRHDDAFGVRGRHFLAARRSLPTLSGNWQFTMAGLTRIPTAFVPGWPAGRVSGAEQWHRRRERRPTPSRLPVGTRSVPDLCNSGSAAITGTINGQNVSLTAVANTRLFTLTGTLSLDGSTMAGSYTSTNGAGCGTVSTQEWSAFLVPPLTGSIQGSFHSAGGTAGLNEQDFLVSGALTQAANTGASSATVTGTLNFVNSTTDLSDYPCFAVASVDGYISGNTVVLQIIGAGANGPNIGQIGASAGSGLQPVTFAPRKADTYCMQWLEQDTLSMRQPAVAGASQTPRTLGSSALE